jgi:hypothetical protein
MQTRSTIAIVLLRKGETVESLALFDEALEEHLALLPAEHTLVYTMRLNRIRALEAAGRVSETRAELASVLAALETKGSEHASLLTAARELAARLDASGRR